MRRLALGAAAAIVFTLASCSAVAPEAARFGDLTIGQRQLEQGVAAFLADKTVRAQLAQPNQSGSVIAPEYAGGTVSSLGLVAFLLTKEANYEAVHELARQQGLTGIAAAAETEATADALPQGFAAVWPHFPQALRTRWAQAIAEQTTLANQMLGPVPDDASQRAFFDTVKDRVNGATFEQVQQQIVQAMQQQPFSDALAKVKQGMTVRIDPKYGSWGPQGYLPPSVPLAGAAPAAAPAGS